MEPLYKIRPRTRLLETREVIRKSVAQALIRSSGKSHGVLDTGAVTQFDRQVWSGDSNNAEERS